MNLVWHIIRKDLRRLASTYAGWAIAGIYLIFYRELNIVQRSIWDNIGIVALITFFALTIALTAAVVQEDGLCGANEFWRTRPIAAGRLLAAKLILVLGSFMVIPLAFTLALRPGDGGELAAIGIFTVNLLACAAVASCTKDLGQFLLVGVGCFMIAPALGGVLAWIAAAVGITESAAAGLTVSKVLILYIVIGLAALGILLNQYLTRRTLLSRWALAATVLAAALITGFWRWPIVG